MKRTRSRPSAPETCPACGEDVPAGALACPHCGSCAETGWSEQARYDALDLPDQEFDYDDFVEREFNPDRPRQRRRTWYWWIAIGLMIAALLGLLL